MRKVLLFVLMTLWMGVYAVTPVRTRVTISNQSTGHVFFQPEDTVGFNKLGPGETILTPNLKAPQYYRFIDKKSNYYSLYLQPGMDLKLNYNDGELSFEGNGAEVNRFLKENVFNGRAPQGIQSYTPEWERYNEDRLKELYGKLDASGFPAEFVAIHKQYLAFTYLNQRLYAQMQKMFGRDVKLDDHYYDFLKDIYFEDENVLYTPKWFSIMNTALEGMEKNGFIPVSDMHYMRNYAARIPQEKLRSFYLVELLRFTLKKGYSDDFMAYLEDVKPLITDKETQAELPGLIQLYEQAREKNKHILRGMKMPDFVAHTVSGKEYKLSDFKGKAILVLDFWFTGCIPCKAEMPYFDSLAEEMKGYPIQFISVSLDTGDQLMALWKKMIQEKEGKSPVLNVNLPNGFKSDYAAHMNIHSVPRIVLVDKEGNIVDAYAKRPSDPKLKQQINTLLGVEK